MDNAFIFAGFISFLYFIAKFVEMRFVDQESRPLKQLVRDTVLVFICAVIGTYIVEQISPTIAETIHSSSPPVVFNDAPDF